MFDLKSFYQQKWKTIESFSFTNQRLKSQEWRSVHAQKIANGFKVEFRLEKHNNIKSFSKDEFLDLLESSLLTSFKQIAILENSERLQLLVNKKGATKLVKTVSSASKKTSKQKNYLIPENSPCDFLFEIGVMDAQGQVIKKHFKKFKQINRFTEIIHHMYKDRSLERINIVDFGSGKSYLSFALFYYFKTIRQIPVKLTGLDLKEEVIAQSNRIATKLGYDGLQFKVGKIDSFDLKEKVDLIVTLHACDTATDDAINFAIKNEAQDMVFVPCCQHELNRQLNAHTNAPLLEHGIVRDKLCALITDTLRGKLIESCGYRVKLMEFIDLEHTAKNIMLRCERRKDADHSSSLKEYQAMKEHWQVTPYLEKLLFN